YFFKLFKISSHYQAPPTTIISLSGERAKSRRNFLAPCSTKTNSTSRALLDKKAVSPNREGELCISISEKSVFGNLCRAEPINLKKSITNEILDNQILEVAYAQFDPTTCGSEKGCLFAPPGCRPGIDCMIQFSYVLVTGIEKNVYNQLQQALQRFSYHGI
ncbi:unnamed protein product, partial [Cylicostephanus goldi]